MNIRKKNDEPFASQPFNYFIIDTDVGGDDAQALMLGFHFAKKYNKTLLGITAIDGNTTVENVVTNILLTMAVSDVKYPVYQGSQTAILGTKMKDGYFGQDGFGGKQKQYLEKYGDKIDHSLVQKEPAWKFIAQSALKYKDQIAIVALGPLTNLAIAYHYDSSIVNCISMLSLMGSSDSLAGMGQIFCSEFNMALDAEAAYIVMNSFKNIVAVSFDTTILGIDPQKTLFLFEDDTTPKSKLVKDLYEKILTFQAPSLCDPLGLFSLFRPDLVKSGMKLQLDIELKGKRTKGSTKINWFNEDKDKENVYIIRDFNVEEILNEVIESYK